MIEDEPQGKAAQGEFSYELKIPRDRVGAVVGKEGATKKQLEAQTKSKIQISADGDVHILGEDSFSVYLAKEVVRAVGRGFNPIAALNLVKTDYTMEVIDLRHYTGDNKNALLRLRGRVIGTEGKSRKELEHLAEVNISVYGKTIAIIGPVDRVTEARRALELILSGSKHSTAYRYLEKKRRDWALEKVKI